MENNNCENCGFRAKYDNNPKSFSGWLWRWHANWCPGWKAYIREHVQLPRCSFCVFIHNIS